MRGRAPYVTMPFSNNDGSVPVQREMRRYGGRRPRFCVRTCDGRYFPITASDNASRAASCNSFCRQAKQTGLGSNIDNAATETGEPYSELPNAFRYRKEIVAGCTCNGKDPVGLASVKIEDDPTLRKGDIVAGENGLQVVGRSDKTRRCAETSRRHRTRSAPGISACRWWRRSEWRSVLRHCRAKARSAYSRLMTRPSASLSPRRT